MNNFSPWFNSTIGRFINQIQWEIRHGGITRVKNFFFIHFLNSNFALFFKERGKKEKGNR